MTRIILDEVDDATFDKLAKLAASGERSIEDQAKKLLADAVDERTARRNDRLAIADRIAAMTPKNVSQTNSTALVRSDRDR